MASSDVPAADAGTAMDAGPQASDSGQDTAVQQDYDDSSGDAGSDAAVTDSGNASPACGGSCDDGIDCTKDECLNGVCAHKIDAAACEPGKACDPRGSGCAATSPCGDSADCADSDPCTRNETCNTSVASCEWDILDGDGDGHAAPSCGGDDSNDANRDVYPGSPEICDGIDNDLDDEVDEEPAASDSCGGVICAGGSCPGCTSLRDREGLDREYLWNTTPTTVWGVAASCVATGSTPTSEKTCFNDRVDEYLSSQCRQCFYPYMDGYTPCCIVYPPPPEPDCLACLCVADGPIEDYEACSAISSSMCM